MLYRICLLVAAHAFQRQSSFLPAVLPRPLRTKVVHQVLCESRLSQAHESQHIILQKFIHWQGYNTQDTTLSTTNPFSLSLSLSVDEHACTINQVGRTKHTGVKLAVDIALHKWHNPDASFPYLCQPDFAEYNADADTVWDAVTAAVNRAAATVVRSAAYQSGEWSGGVDVQAVSDLSDRWGSVRYEGVQTSDFLPQLIKELKAELASETFREKTTKKGWEADNEKVMVQSVKESSLSNHTQLWVKTTGLSITADCQPSVKGRSGRMLIGDPKPKNSARA